jgi:hypothetical protein
MPRNDAHIPKQTEKAVYQESNSSCSFCGEDTISTLEIHHIISRENGGSNTKGNLIVVCANCHSKITNGEIPFNAVIARKKELQKKNKTPVNQTSKNIIKGNFSNSFVANNMNVILNKEKQKSPKFNYPANAIGSDLDKLNYVKRLIKRYQEFKKADRTIQKMEYSRIYTSIQNTFYAKYDLIPLERFDNLVVWLQLRIDKTILGKNRKSKGLKNYSTFKEFIEKIYDGFE